MQPGSMNNSSTMNSSSSTMSQSGSAQGQFMTQMQPNQIMASELIGTRVVSANNESIGDINDVIVDRNGQAMAAVIGVGGFLGIGEKDVAVPFKSLEFANAQQVNAMNNSNNANNSNNTNAAPATTGSTMGSAGTTGSTTASGTTTAANNNASGSTTSNSNQPERVVLRMTKEELQAAPKFDTTAQR
jgi:sporulation protein YlmC with PRC-barrel domain